MSHIFASVSFGSLPRNRTFRARDKHGCARSGLASSLGAWTARPLGRACALLFRQRPADREGVAFHAWRNGI